MIFTNQRDSFQLFDSIVSRPREVNNFYDQLYAKFPLEKRTEFFIAEKLHRGRSGGIILGEKFWRFVFQHALNDGRFEIKHVYFKFVYFNMPLKMRNRDKKHV